MRKIRNFIRAFIRNDGPKPVRHDGHDLAENVRDAVGRTGGGGSSGGGFAGSRILSEAVFQQAAKGKQRPKN